jgi:dienelactone hydrolase
MVLACALATAPAAAQDVVHFPSLDEQHTLLDGYVYRPDGDGRHPALVFLHGCNGMLAPNGGVTASQFAWGYFLSRLGYVVVEVDSFGPRHHGEMCSIGGFDLGLYRNRARDAYGALAYLQTRDDVQRDRIGVIGWSQGGGVVLMSIRRQSLGRPAELAQPDFRAAVAFYPGSCGLALQPADWMSDIPLLVLQGDADVWTPLARCKPFIDGAVARGAPVDMVVYPGAYHAFDSPNLSKRDLPNYVTRAGVVPIVATDPAAREDAMKRVPDFFARYLKE